MTAATSAALWWSGPLLIITPANIIFYYHASVILILTISIFPNFCLYLSSINVLSFLSTPIPSFLGRKRGLGKQRRVSMRARAESVGHMEVLSLLPTSSWTVLVPLVTQELSYHPPGTDEEQREDGGSHRSDCGSCSSTKVPTLKRISAVH